MMHPEYRHLDPEAGEDLLLSDRLTPVYPTTQGLWQATLRKLMKQAFELLREGDGLPDLLPSELYEQLRELNLPSLQDALHEVHQPLPKTSIVDLQTFRHPASMRLAFEELLAHQLSLQRLRFEIQQQGAPALTQGDRLRSLFEQSLSFEFTTAQRRVIDEIIDDLQQPKAMMRLVQGDVGSGKTVVAAMAAIQAIAGGYQAAMMAPTELLAEQHYQNFVAWFTPLNIKVGWLSGRLQGVERKKELQRIIAGDYQMVIGTHALFQKDVEFAKLALIVVDEQHRFGVQQRLALKQKGVTNAGTSLDQSYCPHQLIMTATPIPRTLAMVAYSDLDCSTIDELPPGRKPIKTVLISNRRRKDVIERVKNYCQQNRQVYWLCTSVDDSEVLQCEAAENAVKRLQRALPKLRIGLVHGRLKPEEKEQVMGAFKSGEIDLLVATTVVEVGVDVSNASLMIIENPERLGLAQLHQLRGRVGRGTEESFCVLLYQSPLSEIALQRLQVIRKSQDGFEIARCDLEMRGPGEVLGLRQAGLMRLSIADVVRDQHLFSQVQQVGELLLQQYAQVVPLIIDRWIKGGEQCAQV